MPATVITLSHTQRVTALAREKRTRNDRAYIIHDVKTGTVVLTQKLQHAADFANDALAEAHRERVTVQSLYEAIGTSDNRVDGCHKMRYRITRCDLHAAHRAFTRARQQPDVRLAVVVTASPSSYTIAHAVGSYDQE
jgi:hypothetical protein